MTGTDSIGASRLPVTKSTHYSYFDTVHVSSRHGQKNKYVLNIQQFCVSALYFNRITNGSVFYVYNTRCFDP